MFWLLLAVESFSIKVRSKQPDSWTPPAVINAEKVRADIDDIREELVQAVGEHYLNKKQESKSEQISTTRMIPASARMELKSSVQNSQSITWFSPREVSNKGGEYILMNIIPHPESSIFCRFGTKVVAGWITTNGSISCRVPKLHKGIVPLSISSDKESWSDSVELKCFSSSNSYTNKSQILVAVGVLLLVAATGKKIVFKKTDIEDMEDYSNVNVISEKSETNDVVRKRSIDRL